MGLVDDILGGYGPSQGTVPSVPRVQHSGGSSLVSSILDDYSPEPEQPSLPMRALRGVGEVLGAPKRVVDIASGYYGPQGNRVLSEGLTPEITPTGQLAKDAIFPEYDAPSADFLPAGNAGDSYLKSAARAGIGLGVDLATDPLVAALGIAGKTAGAGTAAAARIGPQLPEGALAIEQAIAAGRTGHNIGRAAAAAFAPGMAMGAAQALPEAWQSYEHEGFTPRVLETGLEGLASAGFAAGSLHHALTPYGVAPSVPLERETRPQVDNPVQPPAPVADYDFIAPEPPPPAGATVAGPAPTPLGQPTVAPQPNVVAPTGIAGEGIANPTVNRRAAPNREELESILAGLPPEKAAILREQMRTLEGQAETDYLTGLPNKAGWEKIKTTQREGRDHVVVVDLEKFKPINDQFGHAVGDEALKAAGRIVQKHFGPDASRFGGDEFGGLARDLDDAGIEALKANINKDLAKVVLRVKHPQTGQEMDISPLSAHIGVSSNEQAADLALNAAAAASRAGGRGDVAVSGAQDFRGSQPGVPEAALGGMAGSEAELGDPSQFGSPAAQIGHDQPVGAPKFATRPGNPFAEKARRAREESDRLNQPTAREKAYGDAFPLGAGYGHGSARQLDARGDASVNRSVRAVEAAKNAAHWESRAAAFDAGTINAQGRSINAESLERSAKAGAAKIGREERIATAKQAREGKERWEVPQQVYADSTGSLAGSARRLVESDHREYVEAALSEGEPVPPEVLADYPDLAGSREKAEAESQGTLPKFRAEPETPTSELTPDSFLQRAQKNWAHVPGIRREGDTIVYASPSGKPVVMRHTGEILFDRKDLEAGHGTKLASGVVEGTHQVTGQKYVTDARIIAEAIDLGSLDHEVGHVLKDHFATERERAAIERDPELIARAKETGQHVDEAWGDWFSEYMAKARDGKRPEPTSVLHRVASRIYDWMLRVKQTFAPSKEGFARSAVSGDVFKRAKPIPAGVEAAKFATEKSAHVKLDPYERPEEGDSGESYKQARRDGVAKVASVPVQDPRGNPNFHRWWDGSKVADETGAPKVVYRGDNRADRVGDTFKANKATSGRFYFTDDPEMAVGYAHSKPDSHAVEELSDFKTWFKFPPDKGGRTPNNLTSVWHRLSPEQQARVKDVLLKAGRTDDGKFDFSGENAMVAPSHWDYEVKNARGNWLEAAKSTWLESGAIFGEEEKFGEILKAAGLANFTFDSPNVQKPGVYPVYLNIKNPLDTANVPPNVVAALERVAKSDRTRAKPYGADMWDKSTITMKEWVEQLKRDVAEGSTLSWTRIPEKATQTLREMGYDGVKDTGGKMGGDKHTVWIAFEPTQIKSAIANKGTYDPTKANIKYATAPKPNSPPETPNEKGEKPKFATAAVMPPANAPAGQKAPQTGFTIPEETALKKAQRIIQDKLNRVGVYEDAVKSQGGTIRHENLQAQLQSLTSVAGEKITDARQRILDPLVKTLAEEGLTLKDLDQYVYSKHAPQANAHLATLDPNGRMDLSGMSNAEASKVRQDLNRRGLLGKLQKAEKFVKDARQEAIDVMVKGGLLSKAQAAEWQRTMPDYVPLRTFDPLGEGTGTGQGFDIRGKEAKKRLGRTTEADSPVTFMLHQLDRAIVRSEKNLRDQKFADFVKDNKLFEMDKAHERRELGPDGKVRTVRDVLRDRDDFTYKVDGVEHRIDIKSEDPILDRVMHNLSSKEMSGFISHAAKFTRLYSQLVTSWNPEFLGTNFARDIQTAVANLGTEHGAKVTTDMVKNVPAAMRGMYQSLKDPNASGPWAQLAKEFREDGGSVGWYSLEKPEDLAKTLQSKIKMNGPGAVPAFQRVMSRAKDFVEVANKSVESGTRLAAYAALRDAGVPREKAGNIVRNLTIDFTRKGEAGPTVNALYAFANANVQGIARLKSVIVDNPKGRALAAGLAATGFALDQYNHAQAGDKNNDGTNDYDDIPEYVKERNLVFTRGDGKKPILIPLPYGLNVLLTAGRQASQVSLGSVKPAKAALNVGASLWSAFNPLGSEADVVQFLAPTALDPIVQHATNRDFTGKPIMPTTFPGAPAKPNSEMYFKNIPPLTKEIARFLNEKTGGDKVTPGYISISPETIQHYFDFATGGVGKFASNAAATATSLAKGETPELRTTPFARRFLYEDRPGAEGQKYRENVDELETLAGRYKAYYTERDSEKMKTIPVEMLKAKRQIDAIDGQIRRMKKALGVRPDLEKQIEALQIRANKIVATAKRQADAT